MQNPLSIPGGWNKDTPKDTPAEEENNPVDTHSVPRSAAGIVSETGDVVDDAGHRIGKLAESQNPKELVGNTVTTAWDVVSSTGEVIGKVVPDDDQSEYTTATPEKQKKSGGFGLSGLKSVYNTVDGTFKPVTSRLGLGSKSAASDAERSPSQATEKQPQGHEEKSSGIVLQDDDQSIAEKETGLDDNDEFQEFPPEQDDTVDADIKPDDSISKIDDDTSKGERKDTPPTEPTEAARSVPQNSAPESEVSQSDIKSGPKSEAKSEARSEAKSGADKSDHVTEVPRSEVPGSEALEGSDFVSAKSEPQESVHSAAPQTETEAPESGVPKSQVSKAPESVLSGSKTLDSQIVGSQTAGSQTAPSQVPGSQVPLSEVPPSEIPGTEDAGSKHPDTEAPDSEISGTEISGSKAPKSEVSGTEVSGTEVLEEESPKIDYAALAGCKVNKGGKLVNDKGQMIGRVVEGDLKTLVGKLADENGDIWNDSGKIIGKGEPLPDAEREDLKEFAPFENFPDAIVEADGRVIFEGKQVGQVVEGDPKRLKGSKVDEDGDILDRRGNVIGKAEAWDEPEQEPEPEIDYSILAGKRVNKSGNVVDENGDVFGRVIEGHIGSLIGRMCDKNGNILSESGDVLGRAELVAEGQREKVKDGPFTELEGCTVARDGTIVTSSGDLVGRLVSGDPKVLFGRPVDEDGDILDRNGNVIGTAERWEPEEESEPEIDNSILAGKRVNKAGNVVDSNGVIYGRVVEGHIGSIIGRMCDKNGNILSESGEVLGRAELVPESQREGAKDGPFAELEGCTVARDGTVVTASGDIVGRLVTGDAKVLFGRPVDEDGDILDRNGNVIGTAERWEPEEELEPEIDYSILSGKRVNKAGNVVDSNGVIYGRVIEGHIGSVIGRMCDKDGNIRSESGEVIGRAELVPEGQREGVKDGPFADLVGCTVAKDGTVITASGDVVGRLVSGDAKALYGRAVDDDGDILDRNGNVIGKAERWEEPEVEKKKDFLAGRRVNREGNVVDDDGNIIGKLTSGDILICSGKEVDEDGDVVNQKGQTIGHVTRLEDIPPEPEPEPEPETETAEEREKREQAEKDRKLAGQLAYCVEQALDKIRPICKLITDKIDRAERTPKEELDEEELVKQVRPLIEEGGKILTETNGVIRGLDPDGRIQRNAKHRSATREGTPEEFHLAEVLKELTGTVTQCIENAKRKIEDMPHAKEELNPLWGLLAEPLFQILAAVGLLLNGVLGLVGRLLSGLGLGGLVDSLLGGLGVDRILESLGLGSVIGALTGKDKKKK